MSSIRVTFHDLALMEYRKARGWYFERSPDAASRFVAAVDDAIQRVQAMPESWPVFAGPYRWVRVHRFQYVLIFQITSANDVRIIAVAHTGRRSGYWRRRR